MRESDVLRAAAGTMTGQRPTTGRVKWIICRAKSTAHRNAENSAAAERSAHQSGLMLQFAIEDLADSDINGPTQ